jgi:hypothetical protein
MAKVYYVRRTKERNGESTVYGGDITKLQSIFSYVLEVGASWAHEKGNKKINRTPKTARSLISNLNNAVNNAAANGYAGITYSLVDHVKA